MDREIREEGVIRSQPHLLAAGHSAGGRGPWPSPSCGRRRSAAASCDAPAAPISPIFSCFSIQITRHSQAPPVPMAVDSLERTRPGESSNRQSVTDRVLTVRPWALDA
jgi:hypothetical protein